MGWMVGWMEDEWMGGRMEDEWMGGQMDGLVDRKKNRKMDE